MFSAFFPFRKVHNHCSKNYDLLVKYLFRPLLQIHLNLVCDKLNKPTKKKLKTDDVVIFVWKMLFCDFNILRIFYNLYFYILEIKINMYGFIFL